VLILLNPLLYLAIAVVWVWTRTRKLPFIWFFYFIFFSNPYIIKTLISQHESRYPAQPQLDSTREYHILVLGAGKNDDQRLWANQRLSEQSLARLIEGVKWAHRLPNAKLIGSGSKGKYGDVSQAQQMVETAKILGIEHVRMFTQEEVVNTRTEAEAYVAQFGTETPLFLCTSALHMPRAVNWFKYYGVKEVIPAPASYQAPKGRVSWKDFVPNLESFGMWQEYGKEVVGTNLLALGEKGARKVL
jgi:uncharacterized SAM-binding protein YcdF (DUF218 family)